MRAIVRVVVAKKRDSIEGWFCRRSTNVDDRADVARSGVSEGGKKPWGLLEMDVSC